MYAQLISDKPWPASALPSSLRYAKEATLNAHGYYFYDVPPKPVVNPKTHEVYGPTLAFDGASVTATWMVVEKSLESIKEAKLAEIAAARYAQETGGLVVNGATIRTDRESQALITGAALKASTDESYSCRWKTVEGFVELTAAQIIAIADAVRDHVQASFDREAELVALVDAAETVEELEAIVW